MANSVCVAGILRVALVYNGDGITAPSKVQRFQFLIFADRGIQFLSIVSSSGRRLNSALEFSAPASPLIGLYYDKPLPFIPAFEAVSIGADLSGRKAGAYQRIPASRLDQVITA